MQLYEKIVSPGGKTTYTPFVQLPKVKKEPKVIEFTDRQCLTVAGTLAVMTLMQVERYIPAHKINHRKVKVVREAVHDLFKGVGQEIDDQSAKWIVDCWTRAMEMAENAPEGK